MTGGPALLATEGREARNDSGGEVVRAWGVSRLGPERCPVAFSIFLIKTFSLFCFSKADFAKRPI
jgi:hypothetical protein